VLQDPAPAAALGAGRRALQEARLSGDAETQAVALMTVALIESDRGSGKLREMIAEARGLAERAGYRTRLRMLIYEAHLLEGMGEHEQAAEVARAGIARALDYGLGRTDGSVLSANLAEPLVSVGHWDEAGEVIEHALELTPPLKLRATLDVLAGDVALARGDAAVAADWAGAAATCLAGLRYEAQERLPLVRLQAERHTAGGMPAEALSVIEDALDRFDVQHSPRYTWPVLIAGAGACAVAGLSGTAARDQALSSRAAALLARLRAHAEELATVGPVQRAHQLTFAAEAGRADATCAGRPATGAVPARSLAAWDEAAAAWEALSQPYQRATALLHAAQAAIADGDKEGAEVRLLGAAQLGGRLGASPLTEEIRLLARRARIDLVTGGAPGAADAGQSGADARSGRLGLTDREFEVMRLVAAGQSNREIGAELFISAKTASVHVSNILAKLGVASRGEAAATAHRLHLFDALPVP
jgi:DNA-binding CsgD family transcriptional regulator/tetratricopeptide (TPR) repeat protein